MIETERKHVQDERRHFKQDAKNTSEVKAIRRIHTIANQTWKQTC